MFWKKRSGGDDNKLVIFFASDLHGSTVCFKKFIGGAKFYGADVLVMGGDMTGKAVMPIAEQADGSYLAFSGGRTTTLPDRDEAEAFAKRVTDMGFYPATMSEADYRRLKDDPATQDALFRRLVVERVVEWSGYVGEKLQGTGVPFITAPGNDDFAEIDEVLRRSPHVQYHEMEVTELRGLEVLHCGGSTKTPWDTEREYTEAEYRERFDRLLPQVKDMRRCIFNVHVPPHGTVLDQCPELDENLQVVFNMGTPVQMHAGSSTLYEVIETHQPLLGLHGHIHEGRGNIKIGKTVCVNPGSVYPEGILQGVLVTLAGGEVRAVQMTQG